VGVGWRVTAIFRVRIGLLPSGGILTAALSQPSLVARSSHPFARGSVISHRLVALPNPLRLQTRKIDDDEHYCLAAFTADNLALGGHSLG
jgi:hypothetical protein